MMGRNLRKLPRNITHIITRKCNGNCAFCYNHDDDDVSQFADYSEGLLRLLKKTDRLDSLQISGGEPFLEDNILNIISFYLDNIRCRRVVINSNGSKPISVVETLKVLLEKYPRTIFNLHLSVDNIPPYLDGIKGAHENILGIISSLKSLEGPSFSIICNICINENNIEHLLKIKSSIMQVYGIQKCIWLLARSRDGVPLVLPDFKILKKEASWYFEYALLVLDELIVNKSLPITCGALRSFITIMPDGRVLPCELKREVFSLKKNVMPESFWMSEDYVKKRGDLVGCRCTLECHMPINFFSNPRYLLRRASILVGYFTRRLTSSFTSFE